MAYELQRNFSAGEITEKMYLRNDFGERYFNSVSLMRNMIPEPWGPTSSRKGFKYLEPTFDIPDNARIFNFPVSAFVSNAVVVTGDQLYIVDKFGYVNQNQQVINSQFDNGSIWWHTVGQVVFPFGYAFLRPNDTELASIRQELSGLDPAESYIVTVNTTDRNPFWVKVWRDADTFYEEQHSGPEAKITVAPGQTLMDVEVYVPAGGLDVDVDRVSVIPTSSQDFYWTFPTPWDLFFRVEALKGEVAPNGNVMYFVTTGYPVYKLTRTDSPTTVPTWTFEEVVFTCDWDSQNPGVVPWEGDGPGSIAFHQGRMYLGGSYNGTNHIWASIPEEYEDFTYGELTAQLPGAALYLPLDKAGEIAWIESNSELFVGMTTGEHVIFAIQGALDVDNAHTKQHSTYGSYFVQSVTMNEQVCYVSADGRNIRALDYNDRTEKWESDNLTFVSEHITESGIRHMDSGSAPHTILWAVTFDGDLVTACFERDQGTLGWSRHHTQGRVIDVAVLKDGGRDVPYILVVRNNRFIVERYDYTNPIYMDSYIQKTSLITQTEFDGFEAFAGQTVQVLTDSAVHPDVTVTYDGKITIQYPSKQVVAGYGFNAKIVTNNKVDERETGNTFLHKKRYSSIALSVIDSARPIVNGEDLSRRSPASPMDILEPMETVYVYQTPFGFDEEAHITVEQPLPLPLTITGIGGKLKESAL